MKQKKGSWKLFKRKGTILLLKLYSTGCHICNMVKKAMDEKEIKYEIIFGEKPIMELGYYAAPLLQLDSGEILESVDALDWVNAQ